MRPVKRILFWPDNIPTSANASTDAIHALATDIHEWFDAVECELGVPLLGAYSKLTEDNRMALRACFTEDECDLAIAEGYFAMWRRR